MFNMSQEKIIKINFATGLTCVLLLLGWGADRGITGQKLNTILEYVTESRSRTQRLEQETAEIRNKLSVLETEVKHLRYK
jgi:hypothetical protein